MQRVKSEDGSYTAYSEQFDEHYHSTSDGALSESLVKHVIPALSRLHVRRELRILDICFGLGFNTLATLYYVDKANLDVKLHIVSPEFDETLVRSLATFTYPKAFTKYLSIINTISKQYYYEDERVKIEVIIGDARAYLSTCSTTFDIIYQDAFSPQKNPLLWTTEYFSQLARVSHEHTIITTYSTAFKSRFALYENGFRLYLQENDDLRNSTLACRTVLEGVSEVDMEHKIACNPDMLSLKDRDFC